MNELSNQQVRGLHFRSTLIGSLFSGLGVGAAIALLVIIAASVSFNHNHPTDGQIFKDVATVVALYAASGAVLFAVVGFLLHGIVALFSRGNVRGNEVVSGLLAIVSGGLLGAGFWLWQIILVSVEGNLALVLSHLAITVTWAVLIGGAWMGLSSLLRIRKTDEGKSISYTLAMLAGISSIIPWAYFLLMVFVRR